MGWFEILLKVLFAFVGISGFVIHYMSFDEKKSIEQGLAFNVTGLLMGTGGRTHVFHDALAAMPRELDNLLAAAKVMGMPICETCEGKGWISTFAAVCCGSPMYHGECCGNPFGEQQQGKCPDCGGHELYEPESQIQGNG